MKKIILSIALLAPIAASAITPLWMRDAKISPDGSRIAFTYKGDIWTVPVKGGQASRVTATPDYEANPVWSPDSRRIAFAGDASGNFDVYVVDADGGAPVRLTFNSASEIPEAFSPDGKDILFSAAIQDPAESAVFPTARMTELYSVPSDGGALKQMLATPARFVSFVPGSEGSFIYQDVKGFEDEWRKHHTSSVTRDVWYYDAATGKHRNLTSRGGEDTNPVAVDGSKFVFLSERDGSTVNVYEASYADASNAKALTTFDTHPVRFLSRADNGVLAFTYDGELYTLTPDGNPAKVTVELIDSDTNPLQRLNVSGGRGAVAAPDGKSVAFIYRGDVFVTSVEYSTTKQITNTPEAESSVTWSPDSKSLIYTSERDGIYNIYRATMAREGEEPNFANATLIKEEALFKPDGHERTMAELSPDGKQLAFVLDRTKLALMDMDSRKVRELTDGSTHRQRSGGFGFTWSPDSKWIALEIVDRMHDPYYDIALINVADGKMTNLTNSGYFDESPRWAMDGNALIFASERYGMRNHASWGSEMDVMIVFMNRDAYDRFRLSPEDYAIVKDLDKNNKKPKAKPEGNDKKTKGDKKDDASEEKTETKTINVELDGIEDRVVRLTPMSSDLSSFIMTDDGETLYYISRGPEKKQLWKIGLRKDEVKLVGNVDGASGFDATSDGKTLFIFGQSMKKLDPKSDKMTPITAKATMEIDPAAERNFMFDNISREVRERFYTADLHGVDWPMMTEAYRKFLPHINNNYDFAELVSEWLGELNVSHTGGRYSGRSTKLNDDRTASLGLIFDLSYEGEGLKVAEVIAKGPFDRASSDLRPGYIIDSIDGQSVSFNTDFTAVLNNKAGKKTLVSFYNPADGKIIEEVVLPISTAKQNSLLYDRWVKSRAAEVDRLSNGRLGYVHIQSMGDDSFRKVYSDVLGKYNDREGIVIDIRWNGGGRLHEDIEILFSGNKYFTQEIRGDKTCDMPSRRWNKPSIMVMCEACYSNAHGTPWVYKHRGLGELVGMPVPGTMTSVNWVTMQDPSLVFGIPVVGYRLPDGSVLENQQLEPDVKVANNPATVVKGEDAQLKAAVDRLLQQIDSQKK